MTTLETPTTTPGVSPVVTNVSDTSVHEFQPARPVENVATAVVSNLTSSVTAAVNPACMADEPNPGQNISPHIFTFGVTQTVPNPNFSSSADTGNLSTHFGEIL